MSDHDQPPPQAWRVLEERRVLDGEPWISVYLQRVELPDGRVVDDYYRVRLPDYVLVVALTEDDQVLLLRHYRHGLKRTTMGVVGGLLEPGEEPEACARRELLEETGHAADSWRSLGSYTPHSNYGCGRAHLFLATGARQVAEPDPGDLEQLELKLVPRAEALDLVRGGEVGSLSAAAALTMALGDALTER